jgi:hypothetical protein
LLYNWESSCQGRFSTKNQPKVFFIPDSSGLYLLTFVVSDGFKESIPDTQKVTIINKTYVTKAHIVNPASDTIRVNEYITLDGCRSKIIEGQRPSFLWESLNGGHFSDIHSCVTTLTSDRPGIFVIKININSGTEIGIPDIKKITILEAFAPRINVQADILIEWNQTAYLNASKSVTFDKSTPRFSWKVLTKGKLDNYDQATTVFHPKEPGLQVISLKVMDVHGLYSDSSIVIRVKGLPAQNQTPIANAGMDQSGFINSELRLDGSKSIDPDADFLIFNWQCLDAGGEIKI